MDLLPGRKRRLPRPAGRIFSKAFENHVNNDEDVIGLIAYSFYKKSKVDWLRAVNDRTGENPTETQISDWASDHLTADNIKEYRSRAYRLVERYRQQEIMNANQSQIESTHSKVQEIHKLADSTHLKVASLTGSQGLWANVGTSQISFVCTTALAGVLFLGLHVSGLEPLKWFSEKAPTSSQVRPRNAD
jgi:hypothetical protein